MARYKLTLAYDGTDFAGSQRQAHRRTVQSELERAARKLGWSGSAIVLAGRTDAGVHAEGQVAALDIAWRHDLVALRDAFNSHLAQDLAVVDAELVGETFHPRFDATFRRYRYDVRCAAMRHPLEDRLAWRIWPALEPSSLEPVAKLFVGRRDFGAFGSASRKGGATRRTVTESSWSIEGGVLRYRVTADGFLYRMVRRLVIVQIAVGQGRCPQVVVERALESGRRVAGLPAGIAPPQGLRLMEVGF
ncbi:MAG TPA: tRNA pseudouridine(38-40) synthase TruA [Anaerolineales bacterium]|nr:tRNA pseudouridine(38-40) synthase TruA [Anaerolineales bacterium]